MTAEFSAVIQTQPLKKENVTLEKSRLTILANGSWPLTSTTNQIIVHPNQIMTTAMCWGVYGTVW